MLRFGLLGCGQHGERYLRHLQRDVPGAKAVALFRRDRTAAAQLAARYEMQAATSAAELVARDDVDVIVIATPPGTHLEDLQLALGSGKPTLVEKPILTRVGEIEPLQRLLARPGSAPLMVAQTLRFAPVLVRARELLPQIGALHRIRVAQRLEPSSLAWQRSADIAGGGSVLLTGVHLFDLLRWFVGRTPDSVDCRLLRLRGEPLENCFDACFEYEAEAILAGTEVSKFAPARSCSLELIGEAGQLWVDYLGGTIHRQEGRRTRLLERTGEVPTLPETLRAFVRFASGESPNPVTPQDGFATIRMAEACYHSHSQARRVSIDSNSGGEA